MKKISRIKLIFTALPIVVIALLLFIRWIDYGKSYKSLANWETKNVGFSEFAYYVNRLNYITKNWQTAENNQNDNINKYLHIDMEQSAVWFEENGNIKKENYFKLPKRTTWNLSILSSPSITLPKHLILRTKRYNEKFSGRFDLNTTTNNPPYHYLFDPTSSAGFFGSMTGTFAKIAAPNDISSLFVSEEEYTKYKNSLIEINSGQGNENDNTASQILEENKLKWFNIEKYLYQEIAGQIIKAGYSLPFNSIEIEAGSDYKGGHAIIKAFGESILNKYLNTDWGNKTVRAYFKIDYLEKDIWYGKTTTHPNIKLESDRKINLEFLVFPDEQLPRLQYRKYIKQGRKLQQSKE